jgi:Mu transposase-like protein
VPIPSGPTLDAINTALLARLDGRAAAAPIAVRFAEEQAVWRSAPAPFVAEATTVATVSPRAVARIEGAWYSVPCRWAGLDLVVRVGPTRVTIVGRDGTAIVHPRRRFGERAIDYRHYLPELARKPQAVRQVLPDLLRDLGPPFPAVWARLEAAHGPRDAARHLAKILGELERQGAAAVIPALDAALTTGAPLTLATVVAPAVRAIEVPAALRALAIASGCAADYDRWLTGASA